MNERIKELAEQAGMHKWGIADDAKWYATNRHEEGVDLEKFAELIVKECARIDSEENNPDHIDGETYNQTILQHFGIK